MLYEQIRQELQTMTEEDLEIFLSPLQTLIKNLSERIEEQESFCDADGIKKEVYNKEHYTVEVCSITEKLDTFGQDITLEGLIWYVQDSDIRLLYRYATDINDFLHRVKFLLSKLKDKDILKQRLAIFTHIFGEK